MSIVRSKICGITRVEDALQAAEAGADAIGLVFYAKSPRAVTLEQARQILDALPPFVTTVGLFVNERPEVLRHLLEALPLDLLQFHGDEPQEACMGYGRPWFKALRVRPEEPLSAQVAAYDKAQAILLDAFVAGVPGGTGQSFDWSLIPEDLKKPLILAGGLTVDNVQQAIEQVRPWAVDVSGGVEQAKGIKDGQKVQTFIQRVRAMM